MERMGAPRDRTHFTPTPLDSLLTAADRALRSLFAPAQASRPVPATAMDASQAGSATAAPQQDITPPQQAAVPVSVQTSPLSDAERRLSAALMRVNHAGEIAAQALYHGQAFVAQSRSTREFLLKAADEEADHLAWCETRLKELRSQPSLLNPLWYAGSFAIGALAALSGDRTSLGFVVETERQVERHLDDHLSRLPQSDSRSRAILQAMRKDEIEHGASAQTAGGAPLPAAVRAVMRNTARVMTRTAYFI
jgi:ubiquinone biosynthesis monooxygenase Coq7